MCLSHVSVPHIRLTICLRRRRRATRIKRVHRGVTPGAGISSLAGAGSGVPREWLGWWTRLSSCILLGLSVPTASNRALVLMMDNAGRWALRFVGIYRRTTTLPQVERLGLLLMRACWCPSMLLLRRYRAGDRWLGLYTMLNSPSRVRGNRLARLLRGPLLRWRPVAGWLVLLGRLLRNLMAMGMLLLLEHLLALSLPLLLLLLNHLLLLAS